MLKLEFTFKEADERNWPTFIKKTSLVLTKRTFPKMDNKTTSVLKNWL